jgi:hypothetical protein
LNYSTYISSSCINIVYQHILQYNVYLLTLVYYKGRRKEDFEMQYAVGQIYLSIIESNGGKSSITVVCNVANVFPGRFFYMLVFRSGILSFMILFCMSKNKNLSTQLITWQSYLIYEKRRKTNTISSK